MKKENVLKDFFLPTELKDYYRFFQVPKRRWWFGLIGLVSTLVVFLGYMLLISSLLPSAEFLMDTEEWRAPIQLLLSDLQIAGFIGVAVLMSWIFFRQGFGWLSSVIGRFRLKWFAITVAVFGIGFFLLNIGINIFSPLPGGGNLAVRPYTLFMIVVTLLVTPCQAAGEEYIFRGVIGRLIAMSVPFRKVGLALSALIPMLLFVLMHTDEHIFNNIIYISMSLCTWWLAYRTGGIEASVAFHATINVFGRMPLPFIDFSALPKRADTSVLEFLVSVFVQLILTLIIDLLARRYGLVRMSSPSATVPEVVKAKKTVTDIASSVESATKEDLPRFDTTIRVQ